MHGTDEVWVAAVEETAIALRDFGRGGALEFEFSLPKIGVLGTIALESFAKQPLNFCLVRVD